MKHFERILSGGLYRSRHGVILGVCKGLADYFDLSVFWTRTIALFLFFVTGFWPMGAIYFVAALLMKPEPVVPLHGNGDKDFYEGYVHARRASIHRLKRRYESLGRRIKRMEHVVTSKDFDWHHRLNSTPHSE